MFSFLRLTQSWSSAGKYLNIGFSKIALPISLLGYLILFSDPLVEKLTFNSLTSPQKLFFDHSVRLKLIYLGFWCLAISQVIFIAFRPDTIRLGVSRDAFLKYAKSNFSFRDFEKMYINLNDAAYIQKQKGLPITVKFENSWKWEHFVLSCAGVNNAADYKKVKQSGKSPFIDPFSIDFEKTKLQYGDLVNELVSEFYFYQSSLKKTPLNICNFFFLLGGLAILLPSLDILFNVILSVL